MNLNAPVYQTGISCLPFRNQTELEVRRSSCMIRKCFLPAVLAMSISLFAPGLLAQNQAAYPVQGAVQAPQQPTVVVPNVYVLGGFYGPGVIVVPSGGFNAPAGTVGISLANQSGISTYTPIEMGVQSTLGPRPTF